MSVKIIPPITVCTKNPWLRVQKNPSPHFRLFSLSSLTSLYATRKISFNFSGGHVHFQVPFQGAFNGTPLAPISEGFRSFLDLKQMLYWFFKVDELIIIACAAVYWDARGTGAFTTGTSTIVALQWAQNLSGQTVKPL